MTITGMIDRMQKETISRYLKLRFADTMRSRDGIRIVHALCHFSGRTQGTGSRRSIGVNKGKVLHGCDSLPGCGSSDKATPYEIFLLPGRELEPQCHREPWAF